MKSRHEVWKEQEAGIAALERDLDRAGKLLMSTDGAAGHGRAVLPGKADRASLMQPRAMTAAASTGPFAWLRRLFR